jgi:hypothetical protein
MRSPGATPKPLMRDRRSRALAFLRPRQSTDGKSYLQIQADARLGLSDGNAAAYHIKRLRTRAVLTRYTIQIGWRKIGFPADFVILAESDEEAALLRWKGTSSFFRTITKSTLAMCCSYQPLLDTYC